MISGPMKGPTGMKTAFIWAQFNSETKVVLEFWRSESTNPTRSQRQVASKQAFYTTTFLLDSLEINTVYNYKLRWGVVNVGTASSQHLEGRRVLLVSPVCLRREAEDFRLTAIPS
jgi:hypothetical protein